MHQTIEIVFIFSMLHYYHVTHATQDECSHTDANSQRRWPFHIRAIFITSPKNDQNEQEREHELNARTLKRCNLFSQLGDSKFPSDEFRCQRLYKQNKPCQSNQWISFTTTQSYDDCNLVRNSCQWQRVANNDLSSTTMLYRYTIIIILILLTAATCWYLK